MDSLDRLYLDFLQGIISKEQYDKAVVAYQNIPQQERERNGI